MQIVIRLGLSLLFSTVIGLEREVKHRPAGLKTHVIVCLGATIISLMQQQIMYEILVLESPFLSSDPARLIAQCISGIGFLGAGTIIVTNRTVSGLTTAASLWMTACLGLAVGMGYYEISIVGFGFVMLALIGLKSLVFIKFPSRVQIQYITKETKDYLVGFFKENSISAKDINYSVELFENYRVYTVEYEVDLPKKMNSSFIIDTLGSNDDIINIQIINSN